MSADLDPARATDIALVRFSLDSFFASMIGTLRNSGGNDDARQARLLETVHRHVMQLPGIREREVLLADEDEPDSEDVP